MPNMFEQGHDPEGLNIPMPQHDALTQLAQDLIVAPPLGKRHDEGSTRSIINDNETSTPWLPQSTSAGLAAAAGTVSAAATSDRQSAIVRADTERQEIGTGNDKPAAKSLSECLRECGIEVARLERLSSRTPEQNTTLIELRAEQAKIANAAAKRVRALSSELGAINANGLAGTALVDYHNRKAEQSQLEHDLKNAQDRVIKTLVDTQPSPRDPGGITGKLRLTGGDFTQGFIFQVCAARCKSLRNPDIILVPMRSETAVDGIGGDFILINKNTGEWLPIDSTQRDKSDSYLPPLRRINIIESNPRTDISEEQRKIEIHQRFDAIVRRLTSEGSPLHVLETPPPHIERPTLDRDGHAERKTAILQMSDQNAKLDAIEQFQNDTEPKRAELETFLKQCRERAKELRAAGNSADDKKAGELEAFVRHTKDAGDGHHLQTLSRWLEQQRRTTLGALGRDVEDTSAAHDRAAMQALNRTLEEAQSSVERKPASRKQGESTIFDMERTEFRLKDRVVRFDAVEVTADKVYLRSSDGSRISAEPWLQLVKDKLGAKAAQIGLDAPLARNALAVLNDGSINAKAAIIQSFAKNYAEATKGFPLIEPKTMPAPPATSTEIDSDQAVISTGAASITRDAAEQTTEKTTAKGRASGSIKVLLEPTSLVNPEVASIARSTVSGKDAQRIPERRSQAETPARDLRANHEIRNMRRRRGGGGGAAGGAIATILGAFEILNNDE
jgi:hypothetical protein